MSPEEAGFRFRVGTGVAWVLAIALSVRVLLLWAVPVLWTLDSPSYLSIARDIAESWSFDDHRLGVLRLPGYPLFLALLFRVATATASAVVLAQLTLALLSGLLLLEVGRALGLRGAYSIVAATLPLLAPPLLALEHCVMSETLAYTLTLAALAAAIRWSQLPTSWRWAALTGLAVSGVMLTRLNSVVLIGVVLLLPLWGCATLWKNPARRRSATFALAMFAASSAIPLTIWSLRNLSVLGQPGLLTSAARIRLVYAMYEGLVDPTPLADRLDVPDDERQNDPVFAVFWALVDRGRAGELAARKELAESARVEPGRWVVARIRAFGGFLGWSPVQRTDIERILDHQYSSESRSVRLRARVARFLDGLGPPPNPAVESALVRSSEAYVRMVRPATSIVWLAAMAALSTARCRRRPGLVRLALLNLGFLGTVALHAWTLAPLERFSSPFDWIPILTLAWVLQALFGTEG